MLISGIRIPEKVTLVSTRGSNVFHRFCSIVLALGLIVLPMQTTRAEAEVKFKHIPTQFIAALGDPTAKSGNGAQFWGRWPRDPGTRGVWLSLFPVLKAAGGYAPGNWKFDPADWWLDENGLIMEKPEFSIPPGKYLVTGEREVTTVLNVYPKDETGNMRWELENGATLYDVTHLACRSARYTPAEAGNLCSPSEADKSVFKVAPGASMPPVNGCNKQDYTVLMIIGLPE